MRKFFNSGLAFVLVGLLCLAAGFLSQHSTVFISVGLLWIILAIVVRNKNSQKTTSQDQPKQ